jgi:hypothetical protein
VIGGRFRSFGWGEPFMTKLVAAFAGNVGITNRILIAEEDLWTCIIAAFACATGVAAGFALAALI